MRYLEVTARPSPAVTPALFDLIARSDAVDVSRVLDWNLHSPDIVTVLHSVTGDMEAFEAEAREVRALTNVEVASVEAERFQALLTIDVSRIALLQKLLSTMSRPGLVLRTPMVYRDGEVQLRLVATSSILQSTIDTLPAEVDINVREIGSMPRPASAPVSALTDRQQEALAAALDLGYYDSPARASHQDIAARLGCAPSTASEHLKKAEARLVRTAMESESRI